MSDRIPAGTEVRQLNSAGTPWLIKAAVKVGQVINYRLQVVGGTARMIRTQPELLRDFVRADGERLSDLISEAA